MMEKRGVIEPDVTPPADGRAEADKAGAADDIQDDLAGRAAARATDRLVTPKMDSGR
jgi:hypothetical protein